MQLMILVDFALVDMNNHIPIMLTVPNVLRALSPLLWEVPSVTYAPLGFLHHMKASPIVKNALVGFFKIVPRPHIVKNVYQGNFQMGMFNPVKNVPQEDITLM